MTTLQTAAERVRGKPELLVSLMLLGLGTVALIDAASIPTNAASKGPLGSSTMPTVVGLLLVITAAWLVVDVLRGGVGDIEGGEDVDLDQAPEWRSVGLLSVVFLGNAYLIDIIGWPLSGALLFFGASVALGSRHWVRVGLLALTMSFGSYLLFANGLGINLPAGWMDGII